jgi:5-formyltetrahydrofolate cyclo-ligase
MDPKARKRTLRRVLVETILAMSPGDRARQEQWLAERFLTLPGFNHAATVLLYANAFPEEINTGPMLREALAIGKRLVCPRVDRGAKRLRLFEVEHLDRDLVPGTLGIPEPRLDCREVDPGAVDWVLVPGLAFDARGYRVGRGAGHYDRLLPMLRPDAPRWALVFDCQWVEALPVEPHDVPVDGVVSPGRTFSRADTSAR